MRRHSARLLYGVLLAAIAAPAAHAASYDPIYRFRRLATAHFVVYFHQGEDVLAGRLAVIAEDVWRTTAGPLGASPPALTHVVLVDQTDFSNGLATPLPYNTIVVAATWPPGSDFLGNATDWLRFVFTHEFTHVIHLDRSEGWARVLRGILGRNPIIFPNLFLPKWQIEGLATYAESTTPDEGRLHAGDFRMIVGEAARARQLASLDRVNGGLIDWPGGLAAYAYGAGFHEYLADRFGPNTFVALADDTARQIPFVGSRSFRHVYGQSLGSLWRDYLDSVTRAPDPGVGTDAVRRLTHHGFEVSGPRFDRSRCRDCAASVFYSVQTPHEFPALYQVGLDGRTPRQVTTRYLGSTSGVGGQAIYFDQHEIRRSTGLYSDLHSLDRTTGDVKRLTTDARLLDPDLSPDERRLVAVQDRPGRRDLVLVALPGTSSASVGVGFASSALSTTARSPVTVTTLVSEPETQFNAPRWAPDGHTIAAERHTPGHQAELVIIDVTTGAVRTIASSAQARFVTPAWRPDGRGIVVAADLDDGPFQLYEMGVDPSTVFNSGNVDQLFVRQLTRVSGGAIWPDVSPDGRSLVFVGYTIDGFDLFAMPYPDAADDRGQPVRPAADPAPGSLASASTSQASLATSEPYSPLGTLAPRSWSPTIDGDRTQLRLGFAFGGADVLGYHGYTFSATWRVTSPEGAVTPPAARPDWQAVYQYARWQPTLWLAASEQTSFFAGPPDERGVPSSATLRERQFESGLLFPIRRVRVSQAALVSVIDSVEDLLTPEGVESTRRVAGRAGWGLNSTRTYGYSISAEDGVAVGATIDLARRALGSSGDASTFTADTRAYVPLFARHQVLALRLAAGVSHGDAGAERTFLLGGPQSNPAPVDFGRSAISLLRGFSADSFAGTHVALVNADYRWPLAWPQRGYGTWPLFLRAVHAALFADVGHAWTREFDVRDLKTSAGGELSFDVVAGYFAPFTVTVGGAWGHDGAGIVASRGTVYVRVGHAF